MTSSVELITPKKNWNIDDDDEATTMWLYGKMISAIVLLFKPTEQMLPDRIQTIDIVGAFTFF
jgi:hypothetical protein